MVEEAVKTYRVVYERDESGWWVASVRGLRGCHTQGRTVDEARRRIVEAMELFVDDVRTARIADDVKLPAEAAQAVRAYTTLRTRAERDDRRAAVAAWRAVRTLRGARGVSFQLAAGRLPFTALDRRERGRSYREWGGAWTTSATHKSPRFSSHVK